MRSQTLGLEMPGAHDLIRRYVSHARRAAYLMRHGGLGALASAVRRRLARDSSPGAAPGASFDGGVGLFPGTAGEGRGAGFWLGADELLIFGRDPMRAWGGAQIAAQFAGAASAAGHRVFYLSASSTPGEGQTVAAGPAVDSRSGIVEWAIDAVSPPVLFEQVSERAKLVLFAPDPRITPFTEYAKARGLEVVVVVSRGWPIDDFVASMLFGVADRRFGTSQEVSATFEREKGVSVTCWPAAASHATFDPYKELAVPPEFSGAGRKRVVVYISGDEACLDWEALAATATEVSDAQFIVLSDGRPLPVLPANVRPIACEAQRVAAPYLANCDIVFAPVTAEGTDDGATLSGVLAGLFFGKPVVATRPLRIDGDLRLSVCSEPTEIRRAIAAAAVDKDSAASDRLMSRHSWLGRVEEVTVPPARRDVSAIILIHNNLRIIGRCLETLLEHCGNYLAEVIVVDNASSDGGAEYVEAHFPAVKLIRNPENGCSSGRNLGVLSSSGRYLAFFDSDQWFVGSSGFGEALRILENDASIGAIGWNAGWFDRHRTDLGGMIADYCPDRAMNAVALRSGYRTDIGFLGTSGMFLRREVFLATSGFDTYYDPTCFEDTDICFQIKALGMKVAFRDLSGIRHQPHQTTGADSGSSRYRQLFLRNADYFKSKWHGRPEFFVDYTG